MGNSTNNEVPPLFSVVIPTYNREKLLLEAISSVLRQTLQDFEVIVVDNTSQDNTVAAVQALGDPRLRVLQVQNHGVLALSRNPAIQTARGRYVAFLDSDDFWYPEKLERVYQAWLDHPEVGLVSHDWCAVRGDRVVYRRRSGPYRENMYRFLLLNGNRLCISATAVRRSCLEEVGGFDKDPRLAGLDDYDLWLRLSRVYRFHFLHQCLGVLRLHPGRYSARPGGLLSPSLYCLDKHVRLLGSEGSPLPERLVRRQRATRYATAARTAASWWGRESYLDYSRAALRETPAFWKTYVRVAHALAIRLLGMRGRVAG